MHSFPSLSIAAVVLAGVLAFAWGGLYWALATQRFPRVIRFERDTQNWPPAALALAFLTRIVQAFGVAAITAFAGINSPAAGALGGAVIFTVIVLPILVGQAAFGPPFGSWPRLAVGLPEATVGFAIMGAVGVLWR